MRRQESVAGRRAGEGVGVEVSRNAPAVGGGAVGRSFSAPPSSSTIASHQVFSLATFFALGDVAAARSLSASSLL